MRVRRRWELVGLLILVAVQATADECGRLEETIEYGGDTRLALLKLSQGDDSVFVRRIRADNMGTGFLDIDCVLGMRIMREQWSEEGWEEAVEWLTEYLAEDPATQHRFQHRNDNWPFMAQMMRILGGEVLGRDEYVQAGIEELERWLPTQGSLDPPNGELGLTSEYVAPSYNALSIYPMEAVANYAESHRAADLAERILQVLWRDWTTRYHWPTHTMAPPHSRSYLAGRTGRDVPMHEWTGDLLDCPVTLRDETGYGARYARVAEGEFVPRRMPEAMRRLALGRHLPALTRQRVYHRGVDNAGGVWARQFGIATTYLGPEAALGSVTRGYGEGDQGWPVGGIWGDSGAVRTWFTKYQTSLEAWPRLAEDQDVAEEGTYAAVQDGKSVLFVASPRADTGSEQGWLVVYLTVPAVALEVGSDHVIYREDGIRWDFTAIGGNLIVERVDGFWRLAVRADRYGGFAVELGGSGRAGVNDLSEGETVRLQWDGLRLVYDLETRAVSGFEPMSPDAPFEDPDLIFP